MNEDVPLVVSEVNPEALDEHRGLVANPNCTTMQTVMALGPILRAAGIERVVMSTYQAVSGTGQRAVDELHRQAEAVIEAQELPAPVVYPHQIAFNVLPQVETFKDGDDYTTEERKCMAETRKILGRDDVAVSATCARVPVYTGHSVSANVQTREPLSPDECRELLPRRRAWSWWTTRRTPSIQPRSTWRAGTMCSSAASAAIPPTSAASTSGSWETTCARAPRPTRCRSPSC